VTTVLLAEDDSAIAEPLSRALEREGYSVEVEGDGMGVLERVRVGNVDLLVLDLGLPRMDGLEVCRRLRPDFPDLPVLMLTARTDEVDFVVGLDAGADDYVSKPFRLAELLARVRALLRRLTPETVEVGGVRMDLSGRRVLVREVGRVVTRDQLMREVWDTTWWSSTKTLDMHISWLRKKLGDEASRPRFITTVRGVGFRFERG